MNWFERYGIVGMYFLIISFFWFTCLCSGSTTDLMKQQWILELLIGFLGISLPVGYTLTIISMRIYYSNSSFFHFLRLRGMIHLHIVEKMAENDKQNLKLSEDLSEYLCEARMTSLIRLRKLLSLKGRDSGDLEYLGSFCTRRFDVLAINRSLILSTILAPILTFLFAILFSFPFKIILPRTIFLFSFSVIVYFLSISCNKVLEKQIIEINTFNFFSTEE